MYTYMEDAIGYLTNYASEHHITIKWAHFSPITPPGSSFEHRSVIMNLDWHNQQEFIFQLAHEISHVVHGDKGDIYYYHACFTGKESVEYKANLGAVKLLVPYYCQHRSKENINAYEFETMFKIPAYLNDVVINELKKY